MSNESHDLLVAYDGTPAAQRAAAFAAERASMTGESVDVVHVGTDITTQEMREAVGQAFVDAGVPVAFSAIEVGGSDDENISVAAALGEHISAGDYTMVFMGNEERGLFHELTVGSVTEALIDAQTVPVTLVP